MIAAVCYNLGVDTHSRPAQPGGFLLQAEIENGGAEPIVVATDSSWRVKPADDLGFQLGLAGFWRRLLGGLRFAAQACRLECGRFR